SSRFTEWDGFVGEGIIDIPELVSASALSTYLHCPYSYFLGRILNVGSIEEDDRSWGIDRLARGMIVHEILERYYEPANLQVGSQNPDTSPSANAAPGSGDLAFGTQTVGLIGDDRSSDDLHAIVDLVMDKYRDTFSDLPEILWKFESKSIFAIVSEYIRWDSVRRAESRSITKGVEVTFGYQTGIEGRQWLLGDVQLGGVRFRGRIDRIDQLEDGRIEVIDYKTGSRPPVRAKPEEVLVGGRLVQMGVYAKALGAGTKDLTVTGSLHFLPDMSSSRDFNGSNDALGDAERLIEGISVSIREGLFPMFPGPYVSDASRRSSRATPSQRLPVLRSGTFENCRHCPFDSVCPTNRSRRWAELSANDRLKGLSELL
ncbi:MAG TPA: PD-(D/E)XK nuclease family protein, partial [Acidimicrobiales bacterium]|nr:PD-(D/E)XK nuclease family protein [Acidimicrobiales bacterium]